MNTTENGARGSVNCVRRSDPVTENQLVEDVAVALLRVLVAVTHQRDVAFARHGFDQPQRGFLAVVLDRPIAQVDRAVEKQLFLEVARERSPGDFAGLNRLEQLLARPERGRPDVVEIR